MTKYLLFLLSLLLLTIASVNINISRTVFSKVSSISQEHSQEQLFQNQQKLYKSYIEKGQTKMRVAAILVLGTFILLFVGKSLRLIEVKWHFPFLVLTISWIFIILGYFVIAWWTEKRFYVGDIRLHAPQRNLYIDTICNLGAYFKTLWVIKVFLLVVSITVQVFLFKKERAKHNRLFVTFVVLDILPGSLFLAILHDNIDIVHRMIGDFGPKF